VGTVFREQTLEWAKRFLEERARSVRPLIRLFSSEDLPDDAVKLAFTDGHDYQVGRIRIAVHDLLHAEDFRQVLVDKWEAFVKSLPAGFWPVSKKKARVPQKPGRLGRRKTGRS